MTALLPTNTVEQICAFRDEAIRRYDAAFDVIQAAGDAVKEAGILWEKASPGRHAHWSDQAEEVKAFFHAVRVPDREQFRRTARRLIDVTVWTHIIELSGIEALMDAQAKQELRDQMRYVPERTDREGQLINQDEIARMLPEVTPENVYATLEHFQSQAEIIFRRGIVNVFSKLDRRFRSHDGFKVGSRLILNYLVSSDTGHFSNYGDRADMLADVERTFLVLDGRPARARYAGIGEQISAERRFNAFKPHQSEHQGDYFKVRIFKNGNAHLWFARDDLVEKVNRILADHYGEVLGDGQTQEADPLQEKKLTPARRFGFFPSPDEVAERVVRNAYVLRPANQERLRILEPSAGTGNLARRCVKRFDPKDWGHYAERYRDEYRWDNLVDCVEIQPELANQLTAEGIYNRVTCADFLAIRPNEHRLYDRVVMNPPFDRERDIDHVMHALDFLKPDGCLIAVMSAGTEFRETRKSIAFRALMEKMKAVWDDLPAGSFAEAGTYVNTMILRVWKDGRHQYGLDR
ncbi:hypothetical protein J2X65_003538 [Ancylobacter sp. 3268]|uniref:DUF4942 domain-containing protein n=1 Tax=Ancylobacter sp. 3268 TaxID=2817752 RepID=UPI002858B122|nr:DUF4942 domain-containing protein [Ancylobacter sp. 3268]MDR6954170.1 hypothetical protein [Ancylobacter sp. 3268]